MGEKTFNVIGCLSFAVMLATVAVFFLPMHRVSFFTAFVLRAMRIETHLLTVNFDEDSSDFCRVINHIKSGTCNSGSFDLQDTYQRFCVPALVALYPQACSGFQNAFTFGMALAISLVFNIIGLCCVLFALHSYIFGQSHKRSYRSLALIALSISTLQLGTAVALYGAQVFTHLDGMRGKGGVILDMTFKASQGIGASFGYFTCVVIVGVQMFMLAIWTYTKTSQEQSDEEVLEKKLLAAEAHAHAGYGADGVPAVGVPTAGAASGQSWFPQGEQVLFAAGGGTPPQQPWGQQVVFGDTTGIQPVPVHHMVLPSTQEESQPAQMRRGETYMPAAPPGTDV